MPTLFAHLRYALRQLRRSPGFTLTAVLTLGLGLGATATMLSVVQSVLLAPLPYPEADRLVGVAFTFPQEKPNADPFPNTRHDEARNTGSLRGVSCLAAIESKAMVISETCSWCLNSASTGPARSKQNVPHS